MLRNEIPRISSKSVCIEHTVDEVEYIVVILYIRTTAIHPHFQVGEGNANLRPVKQLGGTSDFVSTNLS
jgi:hypothetical protein